MSNVKQSILLRVRVIFLCVLLFSIAIIYKILDIQYLSKDVWSDAADKYSAKMRPIKATRGNIYADDGSLLATSSPRYTVAFDPTRYYKYLTKKLNTAGILVIDNAYEDSLTILSKKLAKFFNKPNYSVYFSDINKARNSQKEYMILSSRKINFHEKLELEKWTIFNKGRNKGGVIFIKEENRLKPFNYLAARTIGYTKENVGKKGKEFYGVGLEGTFHKKLAGKNGQGLFRKVGISKWLPVTSRADIKPVQGYDLYTTLNVNLQDVTEHALLGQLQQYNAQYGSAIVMEVKTGEIKAIANLSRREKGNEILYEERYNHAVGSGVEPGSTFKLASMLALFEETSLQLNDTINTFNGYYDFSSNGTAVMTDSKPGGHHVITVQEVMEKSSNIGFSRLVQNYFGQNANTRQRYLDYLDHVHLSKSLDFEIKGSVAPKIKEVKDWSPTTLPWMSIGYETQMSPLQVLTLYAGVANKGKMLKPILVKSLQEANTVIQEYPTNVLQEKMCSDSTLEKITVCLEGVVERGTAKSTVYTNKYRIAGKTGTAQKLINGEYSKDHYYSSFVGYFPVEDPKYACIVVLDEPHIELEEDKIKPLYGGQAAGPVFRKISDYLYQSDLSLHPKLPTNFTIREGVFPVVQTGFYEDLRMISDSLNLAHNDELSAGEETPKDKWVIAKRNDLTKMIDWHPRKIKKGLVPNVKGLTLRDAVYILENLGLKVEFKGNGRVVSQSQNPNSRLLVGSTIKLGLE